MKYTTAFLKQTGDIRHPVRECGRITSVTDDDAIRYALGLASHIEREVYEADHAPMYLRENFVFNVMRNIIADKSMTSYMNAVEPPSNDPDAQVVFLVWLNGKGASSIQAVSLTDRISGPIVLDEMSAKIGELAREQRTPVIFYASVREILDGKFADTVSTKDDPAYG